MRCLKCKKEITGIICGDCGTEQEQYLFDNLDHLDIVEILNYVFQSEQFDMNAKIIKSVLRDVLTNYPQESNIFRSILEDDLLSDIRNLKSDEDSYRFIHTKTEYYKENYGLNQNLIYKSLKSLIESINNTKLVEQKFFEATPNQKKLKNKSIKYVVILSVISFSLIFGIRLTLSKEEQDSTISETETIEIPDNPQEPDDIHESIIVINDSYTKNIITNTADEVESIFAIDLDKDGDMDVLSASYQDDTVAWYENKDQIFTKHIIFTTEHYSPYSVYADDIDGDGDIDVLSGGQGSFMWHENQDQVFKDHVIDNDYHSKSVYIADIDKDGDMDVLGGHSWFENHNNNFIKEHTLYETRGDGGVYAIDIDNDGDIDILKAMDEHDKIVWSENDNNQFTEHIITNTADGINSVYAIDIDNDGDVDVLSASVWDDTIAWYENNHQVFTKRVITNTADGAYSVFAEDMDNDGDIDVLSASKFDDTIAWYENNNQVFIKHIVTDTADGATFVYTADIDNDGILDILSASYLDDTIAWYKKTE